MEGYIKASGLSAYPIFFFLVGMCVTYHGIFKGRAKERKGRIMVKPGGTSVGDEWMERVKEAGHWLKQVVGHCPCMAAGHWSLSCLGIKLFLFSSTISLSNHGVFVGIQVPANREGTASHRALCVCNVSIWKRPAYVLPSLGDFSSLCVCTHTPMLWVQAIL